MSGRMQDVLYGPMTLMEMIIDSLVHTLQTFSLDEEYTLFLQVTKQLCAELFGPMAASAAALLCSLQNVCAPVLGGAIIIHLLSNIFPRLKLFLQSGLDTYVFSELNEKAVCLAESLVLDAKNASLSRNPRYSRRKTVVFTDVYVDKDNEIEAELLHRAMRIGAVCLSDEVTTLKLNARKRVVYILLDEEETANLNTAIGLAEAEDTLCRRAREVEILYLTGEEMSAEVVKKLYHGEDNEKTLRRTIIKVVRDELNLIYDLLERKPLYLPLLQRDAEKLEVLLIGDGSITVELAKTVFWCGQMLQPGQKKILPLEIHIVAERMVWDALQSALRGLDMYGKNPYCRFSFYECRNSAEQEMILREYSALDDCSYIVITGEDDIRNIETAQRVREKYDLLSLQGNPRPFITYLVEDTLLCEAMNRNEPAEERSRFEAFGSLKKRFSAENIFLPELEEWAYRVDLQHSPEDAYREFLRNEYNRRSSVATLLHAKYKLFSADRERTAELEKGVAATEEQLRTIIDAHADALAWLEHRRWNAYMLSAGYRAPFKEELEAYFFADSTSASAKNVRMKLHPCIVESRCTEGAILYADWELESCSAYDGLDNFSLYFNQLMRRKFADDRKVIEERKERIDAILQKYLKDGRISGDIGACKKELEQAGIPKSAFRLLFPTDFKQYDYDMLRQLPEFLMKR